MPAAGPSNTRAKQKRKVRATPPKPKPKVKPGPTNTAQSYVSQGKAVERVANHQKRVKRKRRETAPARQFVSQGRAVEKRATELGRQTARVKKGKGNQSARRAITRELEGKGVLARTLGKLAKNSAYVSSGADSAGGVGAAKKLGRFKGSGAVSGNVVPTKDAKVFGRAAQDLVNFPAQALPSVYVPASAAVQYAKGNKKPAKKFIKDFKKSDPVYNVVAAGVEKAQGDTRTAKRNLKRAGKAASEHPGFTALEVAGVKGTVGRGIGRVVKAPERAPARLEGTSLEEKRTYSPDAIKRQREKATDKVKGKHAARLRAKAERATNDDDAVALRRQANRVDPTKMTASQVKRRVDERVAANEDVRRVNRGQVTRDVDEAVKPAKKHGGAALSLVSQRIAKADKGDLRAYRDEIAAHSESLSKSGKRANRELVRSIDDVLKDPKADMGKVHAAARRYEEITAPIQKKLSDRGLLAEGQADKAKLIPYAVRRMGATHDPEKGLVVRKVVKRTGSKPVETEVPLKPQVIRAHMAKSGESEPAFLTQAPNMRGGKNFYHASDKAPSLRVARRTGEATRKGTFDAHPDTLRENAARAQGLADATDGFTNFIDEFGHRDGGKLVTKATRKEIEKVAAERQADASGRGTGELELRPVRVNPWGGSKAQLDRLLDEVDSDNTAGHDAVAEVIRDAVKEGADGDGPWALVPKAAADQMAKHMRVTGPSALGKSAQLVNSSFRRTVLSTSPSWLMGNVTEAAMRSALAKAGPRSYATGRKVTRELERQDPAAAKEAVVRSVGGGHYAMADRTRHTDHTQFEDTKIEGLARRMGALWRSPGPKQAADAWHAWTTFVFHYNKKIEAQFQQAMLGKAIRDSNLMDGHTLKTGQKAVEQAARGLKNTNEQVAFGRAIDRMYGKYNKFSPEQRTLIANYTPFVAWSLNALKFVVDVLPRDHPTVTALIAASEIATEEWRKDHHLDMFIEDRVPGFLQGSIPLKGGKKFRASRYTPFGAFGSPLETATGNVLPLLSGVIAAGKGEDWKGGKLRVHGKEANELQKWGFAAKAFAEATVPVLGTAERVAKDGPAALNPVKTIGAKKKRKRVRRSSGVTWNDGSSGVKWDDQGSGVKWGG